MERNLHKEALDTWGENHQIDLLIEEMSELTQSLLKLRRYGDDKAKVDGLYDHVCEEIGDVEVVLQQMKLIFPIEEIERHKTFKLNRLKGYLDDFYDKKVE